MHRMKSTSDATSEVECENKKKDILSWINET